MPTTPYITDPIEAINAEIERREWTRAGFMRAMNSAGYTCHRREIDRWLNRQVSPSADRVSEMFEVLALHVERHEEDGE